jgi:hypothetical protein
MKKNGSKDFTKPAKTVVPSKPKKAMKKTGMKRPGSAKPVMSW